MKLVFLGRFRDIAGPKFAQMALPSGVQTLSQLQDWLGHAEPLLAAAITGVPTQYAINQVIVRDGAHPISDADEIAFLPPMSGG